MILKSGNKILRNANKIISYNISQPTFIKYGYLYNGYAIDTTKLGATNWFVPTKAEFDILLSYLSINQGGRLKENDSTYWSNPNTGAVNDVFFNLRGAGIRNNIGSYINLRYSGYVSYKYINGNRGYKFDYNSAAYVGLVLNEIPGTSIRLLKTSTTLSNGESGIYIGNDGTKYRTICIGTQEWLADNLAETLYNDLLEIPTITDNTIWTNLTTGAKCAYNNDVNNVFI